MSTLRELEAAMFAAKTPEEAERAEKAYSAELTRRNYEGAHILKENSRAISTNRKSQEPSLEKQDVLFLKSAVVDAVRTTARHVAAQAGRRIEEHFRRMGMSLTVPPEVLASLAAEVPVEQMIPSSGRVSKADFAPAAEPVVIYVQPTPVTIENNNEIKLQPKPPTSSKVELFTDRTTGKIRGGRITPE